MYDNGACLGLHLRGGAGSSASAITFSHSFLQHNLAYQSAVTIRKAQQLVQAKQLAICLDSAATPGTARTAITKLRAGRVDLPNKSAATSSRYPTLTLTHTQAWHPKPKLPANTQQSRAGPMLSTNSSH